MSVLKLGWDIFLSNFKTLKFPYKLIFAVTYKCNSKCKTCNIWKKKIKNELELHEIQKFFNKNKFSWINLTGGEVFIRSDLLDIIKSMKNVYLLNITTNGILTEKIIKDSREINKLIPKFILTISIDGSKEVHNKIRGVNCWENAIEIYKKAKQAGIETYIGLTLSPYNINHFEQTIMDIKKAIQNFTIKDLHLNIYQESDNYFQNKGQIKLDEQYNKKLKQIVKESIKTKKGLGFVTYLERRYLKSIEKYLDTDISPIPCKALNSSCFLDPQGDVYPCTIYNHKLGNIREIEYDLKKIWSDKSSDNIRKKIIENECPGCWTPCEAYQSILGSFVKK